ncbi:beta-N-acetylhexosaminidase [Paenibacillus sp. J2TS4]|uniref:beta-N-acetylhexosaminidase n=1 Tax=Paenibacillus sp. J2TS4 TaxID=2807194 RepID=UPI001B265CDF|nr:beta-N-acetylhexosaminidase [Paenibacillus sp. J2TS4]GIP35289.1 N-acetyl-beta-D-glucosaminidase [Paenibacillus sp. J2TS4]
MKLNLEGDLADLEAGIATLSPDLLIERGADGLTVSVERTGDPRIEVSMDGERAVIRYSRPIHFYRALGLLVESLREGKPFAVTEEPQFDTIGPMFDVSQGNAVLNLETVKRMIRLMAVMGLDMFMLYAEDSYDVEEQPYFGYMRGRYTQQELKELDDYASQFGIEMIPCIQTLSHLKDVLKWACFADIRDDEETMLVGHEQTYEFIEQMIAAAMRPVRTKRIHIGMDEAWKLGQGEYLLRNGYRSKFDIMNDHLKRVLDITDKYGLKPMMWSDMYFRAGSQTGDYYDKDCVIPDEVVEAMPKGVQQVYWDYYHFDEEFYIDWIRRHKKLGSMPVFAGGIWNWKGFVLNYGATFVSTNAALRACKQEGVREVIATLWGDDGTECDIYSALLGLQLFAEHAYSRELGEDKLARRFRFCTGAEMKAFMDIKFVDEVPGIQPDNLETYNPSRYMLWQNVLLGLFDRNIEGLSMGEHYRMWSDKMKEYASSNGELGFVFELLHRLCSALALKAEMGLKITGAYREGDKGALEEIASVHLPELTKRVNSLRSFHRERWFTSYKAFGWEVIDGRYGTLLLGLDTAAARITDYLKGRIAVIEELEEERLLFNGQEGLVDCYFYKAMPTASRIAQP